MKEIKIIKSQLYVGEKDYLKLHNDILKSNNLLKIKKLYDSLNKKYQIDKNTFHKGISIYDSHVYIITNNINNKKYIGETSNIVSRLYPYVTIHKCNKELEIDLIKNGLINFSIEFIETQNRKDLERDLIEKYNNNCYNIIFTDKNIPFQKAKKYSIGNKQFNSKKEIKDTCRKILDSYKKGTEIEIKDDTYLFATEMIKLHPKYDGFIDYSPYIKLSVIGDDEEDARGLGLYNIFCIEYINKRKKVHKWGFSTNKIIDSL
jgi:hypothetical protein